MRGKQTRRIAKRGENERDSRENRRVWIHASLPAGKFCHCTPSCYGSFFVASSSRAPHSPPPSDGAYSRRWSGYEGLFFDTFATDSAWIRDVGRIRLPPLQEAIDLRIRGEFRAHPDAAGSALAMPALALRVEGTRESQRISFRGEVAWETTLRLSAECVAEGAELVFELQGVARSNFLAWLGRISGLPWLRRFRAQLKNRQLRISRVETVLGETIYDFSDRHAPYSPAFARRHVTLGLNVAGFLTADLGVGESARCMVRAADAAVLPVALIDLKLPCKNRRGDLTYSPRLVEEPIHPVNVVHLDPPGAQDLDHHHGKRFRAGRYNIGYWAWELPEFPDAWMRYFEFFDEIWCPSEFVRSSIGFKAPIPVISMPHAIAFSRPTESTAEARRRLRLPADAYLFLFVYDLNSYSERKNPRATIEAFRQSGLARKNARLVMKVHNGVGNERDLETLRASLADLPETVLITDTLSRADLYALQAACDCFVSLHRAEGFGLSVAESMYLGKPAIVTDWSATTEFADTDTALPVRARTIALDRNHGPYGKGQIWADPDVAHAAEQMRRIAGDPTLQRTLGEAARKRIETQLSPTSIGQRYRRRLEAIAMR